MHRHCRTPLRVYPITRLLGIRAILVQHDAFYAAQPLRSDPVKRWVKLHVLYDFWTSICQFDGWRVRAETNHLYVWSFLIRDSYNLGKQTFELNSFKLSYLYVVRKVSVLCSQPEWSRSKYEVADIRSVRLWDISRFLACSRWVNYFKTLWFLAELWIGNFFSLQKTQSRVEC